MPSAARDLCVFLILASVSAMPGASTEKQGGEAVVFTSDVAPILMRHCVKCHRPGEIAPMSLLTWREARPWARSIQRVVVNREMPPWLANPEHGTWANDARLSQEEVDTIVSWVEGGAKRGDSAQMPEPPVFTEGWQLGEPDYVIELPAVTVPAEGPDVFRDPIVRIDLPERRWVRAVEFRPGDREVSHHQGAFMVDLAGLMAGGGGEAQALTVGPGAISPVDNEGHFNVLGLWAPGIAPIVFPEGTGRWVEPGTTLILNQHFHPNGKSERVDRTRIGLFFGEGELEAEVLAVLAGPMQLEIPAGAPNHRIDFRYELKKDSQIVSYLPHMHLRGKQMSFTAIHADGRREILLDVPEFDFNWQTFYYPEEPKLLTRGTVIEVVAHFDNSANNPANPDPHQDVGWGLDATDEMMFGVFELIEVGAETAHSAWTGEE